MVLARSLLPALLVSAASLPAAVVIDEIHYNPPEGGVVEFVELYNPEPQAVSLAGWSFADGIRFIFSEGTVIEAGGYVVVCQTKEQVSARFGIPIASLHGDYAGSLDNGGETLTLVDATGAVADQVKYDDDAPWDADADGGGSSLERVCAAFDSQHPANWNADAGGDPSPLAPSKVTRCPPPDIPPPAITINEISYHPANDRDDKEEFIELLNNTAQPVNLKSYAFGTGIDFVFTEDTVLEPGGLLVVCRNQAHMQTAYGLLNVVGDFTGQLSNDGERITLVDPGGLYVDSVRYDEAGDWPVVADGLGRSLEKVVPTALSDDPASWKEAGLGDLSIWRHVTVSGIATSSKILLYLDGVGEFILDNIVLTDPANPGVNLLPNGTFDAGLEPWLASGNHADSAWDAAGGPDASGALRLVASGRGTGATNGISLDVEPDLVRTSTYTLSFDFKYITGSRGLLIKLSGSTSTRGILWLFGSGQIFTPGVRNTVQADRLPPFLSSIGRFPREPGAADPTWITAKVKAGGAGSPSVKLTYFANGAVEGTTIDMHDDGQHQDALQGDGVYGSSIPAQAHNTIITFRIEAADSEGAQTVSPPITDPTGVHAYYVNDLKPQSPLPVYTLLIRHATATPPRSIISSLTCTTYTIGSFAHQGDVYYNVGIRQRGQSVCNSTKQFLKVRFARGRDFQGVRKVNLQSLWTDKSLIRENIAWEAFEEVGMPSCSEEYVRLHANGKYFGLYAALEHPDQRFLRRNRLNPEGNLYKATASREEVGGTYEKKTNEHVPDMSDLRTFLTTMHATTTPNLKAFFSEQVDEDRMVDYQLGQVLTNNSDYPHKNHYLYHDTEKGRWMPLTWDMDLTFGKIWDGNYSGVLHDKMHNPGITPWYTTNVEGSGGGNFLLDKFFSQAGTWYRRAFILRLRAALQEKYTEEYFEGKIAFLHDLLFDEQAEDLAVWSRSPPSADDRTAPRDFEPNLDRVRQHIKIRRAYLLDYLKQRHQFEGHDRLKITEVLYNPAGPAEETEFLELWNPDAVEIDISGWSIEGIGFLFPAGTRVAPGEVFVVAKDTAAFAAKYGQGIRALGPFEGNLDNNGEILRVKDAGPGPSYPATVDFLRYGNTYPWPREADGLGYSIELSLVEPSRDNDLGVYWRRSRELDGSPGIILGISAGRPIFRRGDPDADGQISITDAIVLLRHLFQGAGELACMASADADASGGVALEDAVVILKYLFQDSSLGFPAPGPEECLPAPAELCRESNCRV